MQVKILRLKNGEDVLCGYEEVEKDKVMLYNPMAVMFQRTEAGSGMLFMPWLPVELLNGNTVEIDKSEVLTIMEPRQSVVSYYHNQIDKILKKLSQDDDFFDDTLMRDPTDEEIKDIDIGTMLSNIGRTLH